MKKKGHKKITRSQTVRREVNVFYQKKKDEGLRTLCPIESVGSLHLERYTHDRR